MKKATAKKKAAPKKKGVQAKQAAPATKAAAGSAAKVAPVQKQPQSKQEAADQAGIFLHADDAWSLAYFKSGDLHREERELFG